MLSMYPISLRDLAVGIWVAEYRTDKNEIERTLKQIRNLVDRGLIKASEIRGVRSEILLDEMEACRVRTLLVVIGCGIAGESLRHINNYMSIETRAVYPDGKSNSDGFAAAVADMKRSGSNWVLELYKARIAGSNTVSVTAKCIRDRHALNMFADFVPGDTLYSVERLPLNTLLRAFLDAA